MHSAPPPLPYQCPGENQPISRSIHLGRLASFYHACKSCPHRSDIELVTDQHAAEQFAARKSSAMLFGNEGIVGSYLSNIGTSEARTIATAFGILLARKSKLPTPRPVVVVASDGRPMTAELMASASEGLRLAGCDVVDIGFATSPCIVFAINHLNTGGGLLIGNPTGQPLEIGLKFWAAGGEPLSAGGQLDQLKNLLENGVNRPTRTGGNTRRFRADVPYLACLTRYFHALRPLRFVLDTPSGQLQRYLIQLATAVSCEITLLGRQAVANTTAATPPLDRIAAGVLERKAHFGVWIDGDGEAWQLVDERGRQIEAERMACLLMDGILGERPQSSVVVEDTTHNWISKRLLDRGGRVHCTVPSREASFAALRTTNAVLGGGPSGRFWFAESSPTIDALRALAVLLTTLSQSDRHLSERIADLCP